MAKINYAAAGINYQQIDLIKKLAQTAAKSTAKNLVRFGFQEIAATRGESAYVWKQDGVYMASVIEGLGTKNLVADAVYKKTGRNFYDVAGHDTVASIINDLVSVGAVPLSIHAYWAVGSSEWLEDKKRMTGLIRGWKNACNLAGVSWGGGETPALPGVIEKNTIDLGGSAVGIIKNKNQLLLDKKIEAGDRIIFIKSTGINMNGLSLARKIADKLPRDYTAKLGDGRTFGVALLTKSNIYARLIQQLFKAKISLHYISNITGHGLRKVMRARPNFSYVIENVFNPPEVFKFMQNNAALTDYEMYGTFNMGQDYALYLPKRDVLKTLKVIKKCGFFGIDAGYVEKGPKRVIIKQRNIIFEGESLNLR